LAKRSEENFASFAEIIFVPYQPRGDDPVALIKPSGADGHRLMGSLQSGYPWRNAVRHPCRKRGFPPAGAPAPQAEDIATVAAEAYEVVEEANVATITWLRVACGDVLGCTLFMFRPRATVPAITS
jgi:hypothetical protein